MLRPRVNSTYGAGLHGASKIFTRRWCASRGSGAVLTPQKPLAHLLAFDAGERSADALNLAVNLLG